MAPFRIKPFMEKNAFSCIPFGGGELESIKSISMLKEIPENLHRYLSEENGDELTYECLICGDHPFFIGHIEKSNPNRMLIYCLCSKCYENPESDSIVEKILCYYETVRKDNPDLLEHCGEC